MVLPPNRIADRYESGELIGVGGMGAVYLGIDTLSRQEVAIKRLKADVVATDPSVVERFKREAEALRQINHPNIVKVCVRGQSGAEDYDMLLTPIQIGEREGYKSSIDIEATSSIRIRALAYILLNGDNVIWITFGSTTPTQNLDESVALYESIASTLILGQATAEATPES